MGAGGVGRAGGKLVELVELMELVGLVELVVIAAARLVAMAAGRWGREDGSLDGCDGVATEMAGDVRLQRTRGYLRLKMCYHKQTVFLRKNCFFVCMI